MSTGLDGFLDDASERGHPLPRFVEKTFRDFLACGLPEHGFVRVHCDACGNDRVVPFLCKRRGICSSCAGRRMADTAAHLVDAVLPEVPIRQWVLTLPFPLRYRLACDRKLMPPVLAAFVRAEFASLRKRARQRCGVHRAKAGTGTFVQRFGGALNLNVHYHSLVFDGVYEVLPDARGVRFVALPAPDLQEVVQVLADAVRRIAAALDRAGFGQGEVEAHGLERVAAPCLRGGRPRMRRLRRANASDGGGSVARSCLADSRSDGCGPLTTATSGQSGARLKY